MPRVAYVFSGGRRARLFAANAGNEAPMEFLFGADYLQKRGYDVDVIELPDLTPDRDDAVYRRLARQNEILQQTTGFTSTSHLLLGSLDRLNCYDALVAGGDAVGLGLSSFIREGALRTPMVFLAMGMLLHSAQRGTIPRFSARLKRVVKEAYYGIARGGRRRKYQAYRTLLESAKAALYFERSEYDIARRLYPHVASRLSLAAAPIDTAFWRPPPASATRPDTILFLGNDRQRDFDLVVRIAARLTQYRFIFVTSRIRQEQITPNVTLLQGDWKTSLLSDLQVRDILQGCAVVVLPFKPGALRSLTSVALQAMACAKTIVVSRTEGLWEPEFVDRQHLWFVHSPGLAEWCSSIGTLIENPDRRDRIGANARALVEAMDSLNVVGARIETVVRSVIADRPRVA
jgi:glycosyltransferase involved in cell wall biosynthesis